MNNSNINSKTITSNNSNNNQGENMRTIYVDFDGTLACDSLDKLFKELIKMYGFEETIQWYRDCDVSDLTLNMELIHELCDLKAEGYKLVLWTNRGHANKAMTKRNLGVYWDLFDEHRFRSGGKGVDKLDGVVYDNEEKYLGCATHSVHTIFKGY